MKLLLTDSSAEQSLTWSTLYIQRATTLHHTTWYLALKDIGCQALVRAPSSSRQWMWVAKPQQQLCRWHGRQDDAWKLSAADVLAARLDVKDAHDMLAVIVPAVPQYKNND